MSLPRLLRDELFKYRKRKKRSIDGTVPGVPYQRYRRTTTPGLGSRPRGSGGYRHEDYLGQIPSQYRPSIFSPAVHWEDYESGHKEFESTHRTPPIKHSSQDFPNEPILFVPDDEIAMEEQWLMNMGVRPRPQEGPISASIEDVQSSLNGIHISLGDIGGHTAQSEYMITLGPAATSLHELHHSANPVSGDTVPFEDGGLDSAEMTDAQMRPDLREVTEALWTLESRLPFWHPDVRNLKQEMLEQGREELFKLHQEPEFVQTLYDADDDWQSNLGSGNPYENDDIVEIQPEFAALMEVEDQHDISDVLLQSESVEFTESVSFDEVQEPDFLDEMVEQEYMAVEAQQAEMPIAETVLGEMQTTDPTQPEQFMGMEIFDVDSAFDEITQAMEQAAAFEQPEIDPWKRQMDPYQQMNQMMDMQMQYMANPFQMPGPMGPGFGPMPM